MEWQLKPLKSTPDLAVTWKGSRGQRLGDRSVVSGSDGAMWTSKWSHRWREASELRDVFWKLSQQDFRGLLTHTPHEAGRTPTFLA